jgi:hypothetical protein
MRAGLCLAPLPLGGITSGCDRRIHAKAQLCGEGVEIGAARYAVSSWRANCRTTSSSGAARKKPTFASDF